MSRRTKLLLLGLFLVLCAIPVVHLARSWSPQEPLRVRYLPPGPEEVPLTRSLGTIAVHFIVENDSSTAVDVAACWLLEEAPPDSSIDGLLLTFIAEGTRHNAPLQVVRIPAHGTGRLTLDLTPEQRSRLQREPSWMGYAYQSSPKTALCDLILKLTSHLPQHQRERIPLFSMDRSTAPIEVPSPATASTTAASPTAPYSTPDK